MGVNIYAKRLKEWKNDDSDPIRQYEYWETEDHPFDSCRFSGDKQLIWESDIEWEYIYKDNDEQDSYMRPKNIDYAIKWVKENVFEGNQKRLIDLFDAMKTDDKLYIGYSY